MTNTATRLVGCAMTDASPWSPDAVRTALDAWEGHGQAGASAEECMEAAFTAAFPEMRTEWGIRWDHGGQMLGLAAPPKAVSPHVILRRLVAATHYYAEEVSRG